MNISACFAEVVGHGHCQEYCALNCASRRKTCNQYSHLVSFLTASPESIHCLGCQSPFLECTVYLKWEYLSHGSLHQALEPGRGIFPNTMILLIRMHKFMIFFRHSLASSTWWFGIEGEHANKFCVRPISVFLGCAAFWRGEVGGCCCAWYNGHGIG